MSDTQLPNFDRGWCGADSWDLALVSSSSHASRKCHWDPPNHNNNNNNDPLFPMDQCCSQSSAGPSQLCDPHSLQGQQHKHQYQRQNRQQADLSTCPAPPQADILPAASRDAPVTSDGDQSRTRDHHHPDNHPRNSSTQQQGTADQDCPPSESRVPRNWNKSSHPSAPSLGFPEDTQSPTLSCEPELGGAPTTPEHFGGIIKSGALSPPTGLDAPQADKDSDNPGGDIDLDLFDTDMESQEPHDPLSTPAIDEDGDEFSPSKLVTRPPSPVGGGASLFGAPVFDRFSSAPSSTQSTYETPAEHSNPSPAIDSYNYDYEITPVFLMQLDPPMDDLGEDIPDYPDPNLILPDRFVDVTRTLLQFNHLFPPRYNVPELLFGISDDAPESESGYTPGWNESMPSQSSYQSPPAAAAATVVSPSPPAAAAAVRDDIAAADVGGVSPSPHDINEISHTLSPALDHPIFPPMSFIPPYSGSYPLPYLTQYVSFPPVGEDFSYEEYEGMTDQTLDQIYAPLEDIENNNHDFAKFCFHAYYRHQLNPDKCPKLSIAAADVKGLPRPREVTREDIEKEGCDYQAIPWRQLGISRDEARNIRRGQYFNYRNAKDVELENPPGIPANRQFFKFRRMDNEQRCRLIHFQLRNLLGVVSRSDIFYAGDAKVTRTNPLTGQSRVVMDLRESDSWSGNAIRISTLSACNGQNGVVVAGCFHGEYAMKSISAAADSVPITGIVTKNESGITNHVEMVRNRHSNTPNAVFASNDCCVRVLNCGEGLQFISEHEYDWPVNCSVTSPDSRLRVVVGDHTDIIISDAERGTTEFVLPGHRDFGFAAAWSDDGYTIATGNQDKTVRIFDARNLKTTVKVLPAKMAGVRALRFSPIGYGGKRVLAMAEPADIVQIVDAVSWDSMQQVEFWGEVGGIDFDPSGEEFFIANADKCVGGLMEFSRTKGPEYYENYGRRKRTNSRSGRRRKRRIPNDDSDHSDDEESSESRDSGEDHPHAVDYVEAESESFRWDRGRYYNSRRYKRLGHDLGDLYV